ncbi:MAG: hypothetical protein WA988_17075 [Candidatus Nanopelagicales bacterium]
MDSSNEEAQANASESKGGRPGPTDQGGVGGMATRENAPELTEDSADDESRD